MEEMSQPSNPHPHWWKEIKASGRLNFGAHIVHEGHNDPVAQHYTLWQAATFRLPVAQQQASRWWDTLPMLHRLCPQDFLSLPLTHRISGSSDRRRHWLWLGHCRPMWRHLEPRQASYAELSGDSSSAWPCWWPSMGMMLWKPPCWGMLRRKGTLPTPEETTLLWEGDGLSGVPGPAPQQVEIPRFVEPAEWTTSPVVPLHPTVTLPQKERSHSKGLTSIPTTLVGGSMLIWRGITGFQSGGKNFALLSALQTGAVMMPKSKIWLAIKLQPSTCPAQQFLPSTPPPVIPGHPGVFGSKVLLSSQHCQAG